VESVLGGTSEALLRGETDLAIAPALPAGFLGDPLVRLRFMPVAHPDHALHRLGRPITQHDLRAHRQLVVRESGTTRNAKTIVEAAQRWTVSHMATSLRAASLGYGYAWTPEERVRDELAAGTLKPLPLREGGERYVQLYLVFASRDTAGPGVLRLAEIIQQTVRSTCPAEDLPAPTPSGADRAD
jgi:DNA-binding transcriptional LysR family regulator